MYLKDVPKSEIKQLVEGNITIEMFSATATSAQQ